MLDLSALSLGVIITILPFYAALLTFGIPLFRRHPQATLALALGMSFYFLFEGFLDSTELGVDLGFYGGLQPLVLVAAFAATFVILAFARRAPNDAWPLWVFAIGISIHSFSEASDVSGSASLYFTNLASVLPIASSFVMHKFLEGFVLVAAAISFGIPRFRQVALAGAPMIVLAIAGSLSSLLPSLGLSPFIAAGVGGWMFVTVGLATHFNKSNKPVLLALVVLGFIIVYSGALLHFTTIVPG